MSNEILTVETSSGIIKAKGKGFEIGESIYVSIRPEYIKVSKVIIDGFDLKGKIKDFIYMGTVIKTSVDLKDHSEIKYSRFEKDDELCEGDIVNIFWNPEKAVAIKTQI